MESFADVQGLDLAAETQKLSFPVSRQKLVTHSGVKSDRDIAINKDDDEVIGVVRRTHPTVMYSDLLSWLHNELDASQLDYKLRESTLTTSSDFYQEYVFNQPMDTPDGKEICPMILVRGSYVNSPIRIDFGTFRFTCSNGIKIGNVVDRIRVRADIGADFLQSSIRDNLRVSIDKFANVEKLYKKLQDEEVMDPYLRLFLLNEAISTYYKRLVLNQLAEGGVVSLLQDKIKKEDVLQNPDQVYKVQQQMNAWVFYNILTQVATHNARNVNGRTWFYNHISKIFKI